jgi:hypothetical protein
MSSKRLLKKHLNNMIFDVVEECFTVQMFDESKTGKADKLIEEAANFQDDILADINGAKTKKDFSPIREKIDKTVIEFITKLNELN